MTDETLPDTSGHDVDRTAHMIHRRKGLATTSFAKTHGLPPPDGSLHKGSIFRPLLAPLRPGRMLDLGAGNGNFSLTEVGLAHGATKPATGAMGEA